MLVSQKEELLVPQTTANWLEVGVSDSIVEASELRLVDFGKASAALIDFLDEALGELVEQAEEQTAEAVVVERASEASAVECWNSEELQPRYAWLAVCNT